MTILSAAFATAALTWRACPPSGSGSATRRPPAWNVTTNTSWKNKKRNCARPASVLTGRAGGPASGRRQSSLFTLGSSFAKRSSRLQNGERLLAVMPGFAFRRETNFNRLPERGGDSLQHAQGMAVVVSIFQARDNRLLGPDSVGQLGLRQTGFRASRINQLCDNSVDPRLVSQTPQLSVLSGHSIQNCQSVTRLFSFRFRFYTCGPSD